MAALDLAVYFHWDIPLRLLCAFGAGLLLGFERESHGRAAGVRTTVLVCVAAACAMVFSEAFYHASFDPKLGSSTWHPDPARLAAGVVSGIGFIGGGVIVHQGNLVRGVTTAAVLWLVTMVGLCFGARQYALGLTSTVLGLVTVLVIPYLEKFAPNDWYSTLTVKATGDDVPIAKIEMLLAHHGVRVKSAEWHYDVTARTRTMKLALKFKKGDLVELPGKIVSEVAALPQVVEVEWV